MAGKKVGRPKWVPTPEILDQVSKLAALGLTQEQIAHNIDISAATFQLRLTEYPELVESVKKGKDKGIAFVTNKLMDLVKSGNPAATFFYLKCRAGWKENDPTVTVQQPLTIKVNGKLIEME